MNESQLFLPSNQHITPGVIPTLAAALSAARPKKLFFFLVFNGSAFAAISA